MDSLPEDLGGLRSQKKRKKAIRKRRRPAAHDIKRAIIGL
jgi:hypothetical protein